MKSVSELIEIEKFRIHGQRRHAVSSAIVKSWNAAFYHQLDYTMGKITRKQYICALINCGWTARDAISYTRAHDYEMTQPLGELNV